MRAPCLSRIGLSAVSVWLLSMPALAQNTAPVPRGIARVNVNEDAAATTISLYAAFDDAQDPDNKLKFAVTANSNTGLVTTQISAGQLKLSYKANKNGSANLTVRCTDTGGLFVQTTFQVVVKPVNDAPVLNTIPTQSAKVGMVMRVTIAGRDPDLPNDTLQFGLDATSISRGMTLNTSTGVVEWLPPVSAAGQTFSSTVMVRDAAGLTAMQTFSIEVAVPVVTTSPPLLALHDRTSVGIGQTVDLGTILMANDVTNGRPIRIAQLRFPFSVRSAEGLQYSVSAQGIVSIRYTNNGYTGTQVVNYTIADDAGRTDSGWLTIQGGNYVPPSQPPAPTVPVLQLSILPNTAAGTVIGTAAAFDPDGGSIFFREADSNLFPELKSNGGDAVLVTNQKPGEVMQPAEGLAPFSIHGTTGAIRYVGGVTLTTGQVYVRNYLVYDGVTGTPAANNFNPNFGKIVVTVR